MSRKRIERAEAEVEETPVQDAPEQEEVQEEVQNGEESSAPRAKIKTVLEGTLVKITVLDGQAGEVVLDTAELSSEIQAKCIPFAVGKKLGSQGAACGKSGVEAEAAIQAMWTALKEGKWVARTPATPKISINELTAKAAALPDEQREAAMALLKELGLSI